MKKFIRGVGTVGAVCLLSFGITALSPSARASIAWGTLNNFDCVNDTGVPAHGFEIELDDVRSTDITYTYDYNHYGVPKITQDNSDPAHPKVFVRYASAKNPDGTWAAFTAVPSAPIPPTLGHQFTNPSVNFGGEHFGVGYYSTVPGIPSALKYNWLIDDGTGNLIHGPPVNVSTPTFTYNPPAPAAPAFVVAVVVPPPPPAPPVFQFGDASWVKEIKTSTHNTNKVELNQLVGDDPDKPQPWANGEPAEVEMEWKLLQTEFANAANPKGFLQGANEDLPGGDEIITRRYEFYKYLGPIDAETGEAMADAVGAADPDGVHFFGSGMVTYADHFDVNVGEWVTVTVDLATNWVVGEFFGAQMAGFDVAPALGLVDHLQDGDLNVAYPDRTVVIPGNAPFLAALKNGSPPDGLRFDDVTGVLSGTPTVPGVFTFTIEAADTTGVSVTNTYSITIPGAVPATGKVATSASPLEGGTTSGDGTYNTGTHVTVVASHNPGFAFVNWTENGLPVSATAVYPFTVNGDRTLVANFVQTFSITTSVAPSAGGTTTGDGTYNGNTQVTVTATANPGYRFVNWTDGAVVVSASDSYTFTISASRTLVANFTTIPATFTVTTSPSPSTAGTTTGNGTYKSGASVTVTAKAKPGFAFVNWTEGAVVVSKTARYTFTVNADRTLAAQFQPTYKVTASPSVLSPTDGRMMPVTISLVSGDPSVRGKIVRVSADEASSGTSPDWVITGDLTLKLRATCLPFGRGRVYTINVRCTNSSGYTITRAATVTVPRTAVPSSGAN